ncbi:MAG TPA: hypothetical protein VFZ83_08810, partial [Acidimicrobiia bacterium]|nr:hypothetical protein [Acidimicrobiia bacterium]
MATPGREPESVEQDATTLRDDTEITLLDHDVAVVHADGIEIVVDDRTRPVEVVAVDDPPARWRRALRPLIVAAAVVITLLVVALGAAALRDDGDDVATDSSPSTARTTPSSAPQTSIPTSAVPTTDAPAVVPPPVSTPDTQPPVTQPPATQPSTPPTTHSPTDYTGLTRTLSTTQISAPPGGAPAFTLTFVNTSSWTMRVPMPPCAYVTGGSQVCTAGGVLEELAPGGSITRNLSVTAPSTPGTYQVRVTNVANGDLTLT